MQQAIRATGNPGAVPDSVRQDAAARLGNQRRFCPVARQAAYRPAIFDLLRPKPLLCRVGEALFGAALHKKNFFRTVAGMELAEAADALDASGRQSCTDSAGKPFSTGARRESAPRLSALTLDAALAEFPAQAGSRASSLQQAIRATGNPGAVPDSVRQDAAARLGNQRRFCPVARQAAYRPAIFDLLRPKPLLCRVGEALFGAALHKQNFRRTVAGMELVEAADALDASGRQSCTDSAGKPFSTGARRESAPRLSALTLDAALAEFPAQAGSRASSLQQAIRATGNPGAVPDSVRQDAAARLGNQRRFCPVARQAAYRPAIFDLLRPKPLLCRVGEALFGAALHKQNFRRTVAGMELVEAADALDASGRQSCTDSAGKPFSTGARRESAPRLSALTLDAALAEFPAQAGSRASSLQQAIRATGNPGAVPDSVRQDAAARLGNQRRSCPVARQAAYRPARFDLLRPKPLLCRVGEALFGAALHKQNFRRTVTGMELVEAADALDA